MTAEQILNIGIKLIGCYLVASAIIFAPQIAIAFDMQNAGDYDNFWLIIVSTISSFMLSMLLGYIFSVETHLITAHLLKKENDKNIESPGIFLIQWIQLLGLLLFCISIGDLIEGVASAVTIQGPIAINVGMIAPGLVSVIFGILFVVKAPIIATVLNAHSKKA